ncbi:Outer membrane usher protein fimD precursor [Buttiauxella agrestis]|uniref:Outer membrane usher protein fimD n=1 Tax=Buttiauxella agrestis TaxID=82977 RepID=A0A381C6A5_9ENTR|nr:fimbria/pilus outer membrane usher protein [Buttiauxella agrestis]SUW63380.1 Outer membrane usher protein fimD precursor [Buttiauxella agrestis]
MSNHANSIFPFSSWRLNAFLRCITGVYLLSSHTATAGEYTFNASELEGDPSLYQDVDLSLFSNTKAQLPGTYQTITIMNKQRLSTGNIAFTNAADGSLQPQLTPTMLRKWGIRVDAFPELAASPPDTPLAKPIGDYIPAATTEFDFNKLTLNISMPQIAVFQANQGSVDPALWDDGVPVLFSDYAFAASQSEGSDDSTTKNQYLNLRSGLNVGGWRLRNYSTWNRDEDQQSWEALQTFIQHDVQALKSQFTAGESNTRGDVFDSLQYRGVNLASDDEMLPFNQRGFAPVIRGIANSNAEVSVRQNGYLIYRANVAPGAFALTDINSTSNSGDLEITIKEADGTEHRFTQPYASVPLMQRPGQTKYEITAGKYRAQGDEDYANEPGFVQGSAVYGLNNNFTIYGGLLGSPDYWSVVSGLGMALGYFGSLSADATWADAQLDSGKKSDGQSWRLMYSKNIETTDTNFSVASYRYSTSGFYNFADANQKYDGKEDDWSFNYNKRSRIQLNINQNILNCSLYINGYQQDYWGTNNKERSISAGFSSVVSGISWHLNYSYSKLNDNEDDRMIAFGFSVPLGRWLSNSWATYNISNSRDGSTNQTLGLSGSMLDDQRLNYSLQQSRTNHDGTDNSSVYATYRSQYANLNAGYYYATDNSSQLSYGISGALVAHPAGITLSQPLGDEFAIIDANGASGVRFQNQRGVQTDWFGNAIIPSLSAYQENRIGVDTTTLPDDVETNETAITLVPTRNAAVIAHIDARKGYRTLVTLTRENSKLVPFGAMASIQNPAQSGIVDENGVVYLAGITGNTDIAAKWGEKPDQQCNATLILPESPSQTDNPAGLLELRATCNKEQPDVAQHH